MSVRRKPGSPEGEGTRGPRWAAVAERGEGRGERWHRDRGQERGQERTVGTGGDRALCWMDGAAGRVRGVGESVPGKEVAVRG